ncbi:sensor histidine kinase [Streptacidiphilus sp. PAMC 29251]
MLRSPLARLPFRARLAAAISLWFTLATAALLALVITLAAHGTVQTLHAIVGATDLGRSQPATSAGPAQPWSGTTAPAANGSRQPIAISLADQVKNAALHQMLLWSGLGLLVMALAGSAMGWWLAGRAVRPVRRVTETARRISEENLHERMASTGPHDELRELADTFDTMLQRLDRAFDSQRRFVANASHELRTPLAVQRASIEVGLADPLPANLHEVREDLLAVNRDAEHLIAALLLLARSDRGLDRTEPVRLDLVAAAVLAELRPVAEDRGIAVRTLLQPAGLDGDPVLLKHLLSNLVRNALQYNHPGGEVEVTVTADRLSICNSGPVVLPERVPDLFEPFRRLDRDRLHGPGHGLGLSIARSIASAHQAALTAAANPDGGLTVEIRLRAVPDAG